LIDTLTAATAISFVVASIVRDVVSQWPRPLCLWWLVFNVAVFLLRLGRVTQGLGEGDEVDIILLQSVNV